MPNGMTYEETKDVFDRLTRQEERQKNIQDDVKEIKKTQKEDMTEIKVTLSAIATMNGEVNSLKTQMKRVWATIVLMFPSVVGIAAVVGRKLP